MEFLNLTKQKIFSIMKTALFVIPIILLVKKAYILKYGDFTIVWDIQYCLNYFVMESSKALFSFGLFCSIFILAFLAEYFVLPFLSMFIDSLDKRNRDVRKMMATSYTILRKGLGVNPYSQMNKTDKMEFFNMLMFIPVTYILWMIYVNTIIAYFSILIILIVFYLFFKIINTAIQ